MQNFFLILTGMAFGSILLVVTKLLIEFRHILTARILSLLLLTSACYMVQPFVTQIPLLDISLGIISMTSPALFWMFASTLFQMGDDEQKLHRGHYVGLVLCLGVASYQCLQDPTQAGNSIVHLFSLLLTSSLALLGLFDIFRNWQSDLVECRRVLRASLSITSGAFLLFIVVNEFIYGHGELPIVLTYVNIAIITLFAMVFGYIILVSDSNILTQSMDELTPEPLKPEETQPTAGDKLWLDKLNYAMETELRYRQVDLTIRNLAEHVSIPEHQLRKLINQHLGYRNFNDYLNRYRVREAAQRLADPELVHTPILTIAIESGYASLTTFNKAFKTLKEMTPSEFRRTSSV